MKIALIVFVVLDIITLIACKARSDSGDSSAKGLVVAENRRWPDAQAEVCWRTSGYEDVKKIIKTSLEEQFNKRTKFRFYGFKDCTEEVKGKLSVSIEPTARPAMVVGYASQTFGVIFAPPFPKDYAHCLTSDEWTKACIVNTALHEFGHAAGLYHEQDREDSTCDSHTGLSKDPSRRPVGNYDDDSIMNACHPEYFFKQLPLSEGDVKAINFLYNDKK